MAESDSSWGISAGFKTRPDKGCIFALLDELERNDFNQNKSLTFLQVPPKLKTGFSELYKATWVVFLFLQMICNLEFGKAPQYLETRLMLFQPRLLKPVDK